jgi:hypothetical protein
VLGGALLIDPAPPLPSLELRQGAWLGLAGALIARIGSWATLREAPRPAPPVGAA